MPSPVMDLKGFSSSSRLSDETLFSGERQVGFWKSDTLPDQNGATGGKLFNGSPLSKLLPADTLSVKSLDHADAFPTLEEKVNLRWDMPAAVQMERAVSRSLGMMRPVDPELGSQSSVGMQAASPYLNGDKINLMGSRYENSLFSSSLSDLFSRKMKLTSNGTLYGHSVDTVASHFEEEEPLESLEELEAQTIGNLLPNDDDLLSGVTDGLDFVMHPDKGDDVEELDLFSSVGGMDLEDDDVSAGKKRLEYPGGFYNGLVAGEHPYGEHPSRTLFVRNINSNVEDSELHALFEQYGDIRTLYTACKHRGFVMISYYDIRAARTAMKALQNKSLRRRKLDIHYSIPKDNPSEKDANQGTLVVFNLDPSVSNDELHRIFGDYGEIKEIRETPHRSNHKFVEFYDVRAAEAALSALDKSDIAGKQIKVEPSRPGGARRSGQQPSLDLEQDESGISVQQNGSANSSVVAFSAGAIVSSVTNEGNIMGMHSALRSPVLETAFHHGISSSVPDGLPSLLRVGSAGNHPGLIESSHARGQLKLDIRSVPGFHPHSLPEYHDGLVNAIPSNSPGTMGPSINQRVPERIDSRQFSRIGSKGHSLEVNEGVFGSSGNGSSPIPGHPFSWGNSYHSQPPSMMWPNSPSFVNGLCTASPAPRLQGLHGAPSQMLNTVLPINSHHVGSAPTVNPSIWDQQQVFAGESPDARGFHPVSLGNMCLPNNSLHSMEFMPHNIFPPGGNCIDLSMAQKNIGQQSHHQRSMMFPGRGQMMPVVSSFDSPSERVRSRRNEGASNQADNKKQYELDIDRIMRGEDNRTTLMIKNIPNKYTSKMLLAAIDERHRGTYDFIYLPIDFKNKCNVGYAFINMTDPSQIIPFYKAFNGKKWEKFNSEKVASLAYARIQGKAALIAHFQNSSLMNEDKRCRPILFNTEGPNAGDQVPFPMGVNVRTRPGKARTASLEEINQGSHFGSNGEDSNTGEASVSSVKDSD